MSVIIAFPGDETLGAELARRLDASQAALETRRFPDGEHYVRIDGEVRGKRVWLAARIERADKVLLPLLFAADALRDLGAIDVGLAAPYLPYMRQDRRFKPGEAVSSASFGRLLSAGFDRLATVDPHLHRRTGLGEIFTIPTQVAHVAPLLGAWIAEHVPDPLVVGPDEESGQWARDAARTAGAPCVLLKKQRLGDLRVAIDAPDLARWAGCTPVIVDDIASSGTTAARTAMRLRDAGFPPPVVMVVHALLPGGFRARLAPHIDRVVSTDTVIHPSNEIGVAGILAVAMKAVGAPKGCDFDQGDRATAMAS